MGAKRLSTLQSALADRKQVQVDQVRFPHENILECRVERKTAATSDF